MTTQGTKRDEPSPEEVSTAQSLMTELEQSGGILEKKHISKVCSQFHNLFLPEGWRASPERLQIFITFAERLRAWQTRYGYREDARRTYMALMKARRRWLWKEGLQEGRLGMAVRSWLYFVAEMFTGYGEGLARWFFSSLIMIYLFGFIFILVDYLQVLSRGMPVFDMEGGNIAGMYFYLSGITFFGLGFRTLQFEDFLGVWLVDVEFLIGKLMLLGLTVILIRKFLKQSSAY